MYCVKCGKVNRNGKPYCNSCRLEEYWSKVVVNTVKEEESKKARYLRAILAFLFTAAAFCVLVFSDLHLLVGEDANTRNWLLFVGISLVYVICLVVSILGLVSGIRSVLTFVRLVRAKKGTPVLVLLLGGVTTGLAVISLTGGIYYAFYFLRLLFHIVF